MLKFDYMDCFGKGQNNRGLYANFVCAGLLQEAQCD